MASIDELDASCSRDEVADSLGSELGSLMV